MVDGRIKVRIIIAGLLGGCAIMLVLLNIVTETKARHTAVPRLQTTLREIDDVIESVLRRSQIDRSKVTSWNVQTPDKTLFRVERRVLVPRDFVSVTFVQQLNREVAPFGARAMATERTLESRVTVHVIKDGVVIQSIALVTE